MSNEQVVYDQHGVTITTHRIVIRGQTYATANVTSVRADHANQSTTTAWLFGSAGMIAVFFSVIIAVSSGVTPKGLIGTMVCVAVPALLAWVTFRSRTSSLVLVSSSQEAVAIRDRSADFINDLSNAVGQAIALRS